MRIGVGYRHGRREAGSRDRRRSNAHTERQEAPPVTGATMPTRRTCTRTTWRRGSGRRRSRSSSFPRPSRTRPGPPGGRVPIEESDNDLTRQHGGELWGERIIATGRVLDAGRTPRTEQPRRDLAGQRRRTLHTPSGPAPCSARPELLGGGRCLTDGEAATGS